MVYLAVLQIAYDKSPVRGKDCRKQEIFLGELWMRKKRNGENGQSFVEFMLVLPLLLLVLLGILDFGRILVVHQTISEAARDATRYASIGSEDSQVGNIIGNDTALLGNNVSWSITPSGTISSGDVVTVSVTDAVPIIDPIMMTFVGANYMVSSSFSMRVE